MVAPPPRHKILVTSLLLTVERMEHGGDVKLVKRMARWGWGD